MNQISMKNHFKIPSNIGLSLLIWKRTKLQQQFAVYVQIMEARAMLTLDLDKRSKEKKESDLSTRGNIPSKREGTRSLCFKYSSEDDIGVTCDLSLRSGICN